MELTTMKNLLGIEVGESSKDDLLEHYLLTSRLILEGYCQVTSLDEKYTTIIIDYACYLYRNRFELGISKKVEGDRQITYEVGIPEVIKKALPLPKITVGTS